MTLSTTTAAFTITPVVFATFFKHLRRKLHKKNIRNADDTEAVDDILFDEAFHIVKAFLELATRNTLEELQSFTNTYVPPPFWAECVSCTIPMPCCNKAADILIDWFDPEELRNVVGGDKWWQVRGLEGVQAEWIAMKRDWDKLKKAEKRAKRSNSGKGKVSHEFSDRLNDMKKVIFYVHGGGFYFGSINTHRYQIIRLARKLGGRAFAVNYRKAPQYPWPCPLQDVLAGYLYLIRPPPGAPHSAIDPSQLVIAGDSAGGNLALSLLVLLRDSGLPMPAGCVLISPWVDLTHSFPSIMQNTATDIIPPHGFVHKPSTLWPIPSSGPRAVPCPPKPIDKEKLKLGREPSEADSIPPAPQGQHTSGMISESSDKTLADTKPSGASTGPRLDGGAEPRRTASQPTTVGNAGVMQAESSKKVDEKLIEPQKIQVQVEGELLEIRSQFQLYATNDQVTHPLVSPLLNSSLGGLPPLYILAGDYEVLRDECVYLAHHAAEPARFPLRDGLLNTRRQRENFEKFKQPTQVHFQLFDDMCHVLTVFSFTNSANFAYRGIARFAKRVIEKSNHQKEADPFPATQDLPPPIPHAADPVSGVPSGIDKKQRPAVEKGDHVGRERASASELMSEDDTILQQSPDGQTREPDTMTILCERVNIHGVVRPLECDDELEALKLPREEVGIIKAAPVQRWLEGQNAADAKWKGRITKVEKRRKVFELMVAKLVQDKERHGALHVEKSQLSSQMVPEADGAGKATIVEMAEYYSDTKRRWCPFDLDDERPSPSAIAGRRDTPDALALMEASFKKPKPPAHPRKTKEEPLLLSPAEQQKVSKVIPSSSHGLRIWSALMSKFMNTNVKRQANRGDLQDSSSDKSRTPPTTSDPTHT